MNLLLGVFHVLLPCFRPGEAQGQGERGAGAAGAGDGAAGGSPGRQPRWRRGDTKEPGHAPLSPPFPMPPGRARPAHVCFLFLPAAIEPIPGVVELWQAEEGELLLPAQVRGPGGGCGAGRRRRRGRAVRRRPCSRGLLPLHAFRPRPRLAAFCPRAFCRFVKYFFYL